MSHDVYESPLAGRYASPYMLHLFSPDMRFQTWRRLWTALARAQHQLGLAQGPAGGQGEGPGRIHSKTDQVDSHLYASSRVRISWGERPVSARGRRMSTTCTRRFLAAASFSSSPPGLPPSLVTSTEMP